MTVYQWLCVVGIPSIITLLLSRIITKRLDKSEERAEQAREEAAAAAAQSAAIAAGMKALLRDRLMASCQKCQDKGFADFRERENVEDLYSQYHALGGNGTMTDTVRAFRALPSQPGGQPTPVLD